MAAAADAHEVLLLHLVWPVLLLLLAAVRFAAHQQTERELETWKHLTGQSTDSDLCDVVATVLDGEMPPLGDNNSVTATNVT